MFKSKQNIFLSIILSLYQTHNYLEILLLVSNAAAEVISFL